MNGDEAPDNLIDLINRLAEPPAPVPVAMTPQTAGWTVLAVLLVLGLAWLAWRMWRRWQDNAYRRAALSELAEAGDDPATIAAILRRTALAAWPRDRVASLAGPDWLRFLDETGGDGSFSNGPGQTLARAPYSASTPAPGLTELAACWIRRHRVEPAR